MAGGKKISMIDVKYIQTHYSNKKMYSYAMAKLCATMRCYLYHLFYAFKGVTFLKNIHDL